MQSRINYDYSLQVNKDYYKELVDKVNRFYNDFIFCNTENHLVLLINGLKYVRKSHKKLLTVSSSFATTSANRRVSYLHSGMCLPKGQFPVRTTTMRLE